VILISSNIAQHPVITHSDSLTTVKNKKWNYSFKESREEGHKIVQKTRLLNATIRTPLRLFRMGVMWVCKTEFNLFGNIGFIKDKI